MTRTPRVVLGSLIVLAAAAGYGIYWWHESAMQVENPLRGAAADDPALKEARRLLASGQDRDRVLARRNLEAMPREAHIQVLLALARDPKPAVRRFAASNMVGLRGDSRVLAALAALAQNDPDPGVREAAAKTLDGRD